MKKIIILLLPLLMGIDNLYAQSESVKPTFGVELERPVAYALIEGQLYTNVIVSIDAAALGDWVDGVKIIITDTTEEKNIVRKRLSKSYLYAFSNGTLQIGKGNAIIQMVLYKEGDEWWLEYREKGLY